MHGSDRSSDRGDYEASLGWQGKILETKWRPSQRVSAAVCSESAWHADIVREVSGVEKRRSDGSLPVAMAELSPRRLSPVWLSSGSSSPGRAVARSGLRMMPASPPLPLKFRRADFLRYGFKAGISDGAFPSTTRSSRRAVCLHPSCSSPGTSCSSFWVEGRGALEHLRSSGLPALPQGSSFRFGLFCPDPSSLIRPHPPHSRAQPDFAAKRLIRVAIAVRHCSCLGRLGNPRVVPCFRWLFCVDMSSSGTPGNSSAANTQFLHRWRWPST